SRRRHTRFSRDWSSDVCSSDLLDDVVVQAGVRVVPDQAAEDRGGRPLRGSRDGGLEVQLLQVGAGEDQLTAALRLGRRRAARGLVGRGGRAGGATVAGAAVSVVARTTDEDGTRQSDTGETRTADHSAARNSPRPVVTHGSLSRAPWLTRLLGPVALVSAIRADGDPGCPGACRRTH